MKRVVHFVAVFIAVTVITTSGYALVVYDPVNAMYNQIRNALMEVYHVQDIANAMEQLFELRRTFDEIKRFQSGIDEIKSVVMGDYKRLLNRICPINIDEIGYEISGMQRDFYSLINGSSSGSASDILSRLEAIFGEDPKSPARPYITQEDVIAADAYRWSGEVKRIVEPTIEAGNEISTAAQDASPKGAARLAADALGKILVTQAQMQQNQAKLIEIGATQIEQTSREEKYYERERMRFMDAFGQLVDTLPGR